MKVFIIALFSLTLASCGYDKISDSGPESQLTSLSWESTADTFNHNQICQEIPRVWILPVTQERRDAAIKSLDDEKHLELDKTTFSNFHPLVIWENTSIAQTLFDNAHKWLNENPTDKSFRYCLYSSGKRCADELAVTLGTRPRDSSAYLIRAIAKHEQTGFYSVSECEDGVYIHHNSLGPDIDTVKTPVIVILIRPPSDVISSADAAL